MLQQCCRVLLLSLVSIPLSSHSTQSPACSTPVSWVLHNLLQHFRLNHRRLGGSTTMSPLPFRRFFRTTNHSKISLPSWVWTSCLRKTSLRCAAFIPLCVFTFLCSSQVERARKIQRFMSQPFQVAQV